MSKNIESILGRLLNGLKEIEPGRRGTEPDELAARLAFPIESPYCLHDFIDGELSRRAHAEIARLMLSNWSKFAENVRASQPTTERDLLELGVEFLRFEAEGSIRELLALQTVAIFHGGKPLKERVESRTYGMNPPEAISSFKRAPNSHFMKRGPQMILDEEKRCQDPGKDPRRQPLESAGPDDHSWLKSLNSYVKTYSRRREYKKVETLKEHDKVIATHLTIFGQTKTEQKEAKMSGDLSAQRHRAIQQAVDAMCADHIAPHWTLFTVAKQISGPQSSQTQQARRLLAALTSANPNKRQVIIKTFCTFPWASNEALLLHLGELPSKATKANFRAHLRHARRELRQQLATDPELLALFELLNPRDARLNKAPQRRLSIGAWLSPKRQLAAAV